MKTAKNKSKSARSVTGRSMIRSGDTVMVIAGGTKGKREVKGKTGKILRFVGTDRVVVEGLNLLTRHQRAAGPNKPGGKITREAPLHISNVMYFVEKLNRPVRLRSKLLEDGTKVRGYMDPKAKQFVQIEG